MPELKHEDVLKANTSGRLNSEAPNGDEEDGKGEVIAYLGEVPVARVKVSLDKVGEEKARLTRLYGDDPSFTIVASNSQPIDIEEQSR